MKHITYLVVVSVLRLISPILTMSGQELISVRAIAPGKVSPQDGYGLAVSGRLPAPDTRPSALFQSAEKLLAGGIFDPAARPVLQGSEMLAKSLFRVPSLQFQRAATQTDNTGDVLIAEWRLQEPFGKGLLVVTDTPFTTTYNLRLSDCQITSHASLATFLSQTLNVGRDPENFYRTMIYAYTPAGAPVIDHFRVVLPTPPRQVDRGLFSGMGAARDGEVWFIDVQLVKDELGRKFYPEPPFIPERFPSLAEQVKNWGFSRVRGEIGKPVKLPPHGSFDFAEGRARVLVTELARRGLSDDQVIDLLRDVPAGPNQSTAYALRLSVVSSSFRDAGKGRLSNLFFQPALNLYEQIGPPANEAVVRLFIDATGPGQCSPNVEAQALATMKKALFLDGPLRYLGSCSVSRQTIAELDSVSMPNEHLENLKKGTIAAIRRNIEHPLRTPKTGVVRH